MTDSLTGRWTAGLSRITGWRGTSLAAGFGALAALGQAPFSLEVAALAGLSGGLLMHLAAPSPRRAAAAGWAFGTGYFALALFW
ncbi:MAG: apolipoprotein N-acyltransferase, partial [Alphaproteobacteria bacterium]|nr:apolipoprotein N-acyltransferase [Alphaproteobacteria bacterium]